MSILIPGMRLPKMPEKMEQWQAVPYVDVRVFADGDAVISTGVRPYYKKYQAIELPPHGRLIDAGATLLEAIRISGPITGDGWSNWGVYALIERQPTIIPPEGGADG